MPISSTLATYAGAYSRVLDFAIEQGWLSDKVAIPRLNRKGKKGSARPGFCREELSKLMAFLPEWRRGGERKKSPRDAAFAACLCGGLAGHGLLLKQRKHNHAVAELGVACGQQNSSAKPKHLGECQTRLGSTTLHRIRGHRHSMIKKQVEPNLFLNQFLGGGSSFFSSLTFIPPKSRTASVTLFSGPFSSKISNPTRLY